MHRGLAFRLGLGSALAAVAIGCGVSAAPLDAGTGDGNDLRADPDAALDPADSEVANDLDVEGDSPPGDGGCRTCADFGATCGLLCDNCGTTLNCGGAGNCGGCTPPDPSACGTGFHLCAAPGTSWSAAVSCAPVVTTIEAIVGSTTLGTCPCATTSGMCPGEGGIYDCVDCGATLAGGGFTPGIACKRDTSPPCSIGGTATFVEVHGVHMTYFPPSCDEAGTTSASCGTPTTFARGFGDTTVNIEDLSAAAPANPWLKRLHLEIDMAWKNAGISPPDFDCVGDRLIDVQGFVYWDPDHTTDCGHSYSGWEIHPVTAWRFSE